MEMKMKYWILDSKHNLVEVDLLEWAAFFDDHANRVVAQDRPRKGVLVSTVFLGIDHNFGAYGPPIVFETMVCRDGVWEEQQRYATWDEAEAGHEAMLRMVMEEKA